ncbi:hypothetical protein [Peribacillus simplex]|uniref:hypothetical protein n=1 Tax=Peribacillus simplex TaxID=1478 RepID=UPI003D2D53F4
MKKPIQLGSAFSIMRPFHLHEQPMAYGDADLEMNHKQKSIFIGTKYQSAGED